MRQVILVNGVPASGKSTISAALVRYLIGQGVAAVPFSLDRVKECLFAHVGAGDRDHNRMLGRASYHGIFATIADFPDGLVPVVDAWHGFQPLSVLRKRLELARTERVVELWCAVTPATAAARYRERARERQAGHPPASYAEELHDLAGRARPLGLGPVLEIDAEQPVGDADFARVLTALRP